MVKLNVVYFFLCISEMALSKRFASITAPKEEDSYNDELLQRLLKKPTNYDHIEPSNLGFSSHRDVPGVGDSGDDEDDEDLDEDWANDFQSLLKSCGSQKAVSGENTSKTSPKTVNRKQNQSDNDTNNSTIDKNREPAVLTPELRVSHSKAENRHSEKKSCPVESEVLKKNAPVKGKSDEKSESQDNHKKKGNKITGFDNKKIEDNAAENIKKKCEKSADKTTSSKLKTEKNDVHENGEKVKGREVHASDHKIKKQEVEKVKGSSNSENKQNRKIENVNGGSKSENHQSSLKIQEKKHDVDAGSVKAQTKQRPDKEKERHTDRKGDTKMSIKAGNTSHSKAQMKASERSEKREDKPNEVKHKVTKDQSETSSKITQSEVAMHEETFKELKKREVVAPDKKDIQTKSKIIEPDTKKNRPYVIREATSFPLDDLLPAAGPVKKPRTSLDSQISHSRESPSSARKRHKSEMIPSHQIGAKKQKMDVQSKFRIDETDFDRNESGNISYIPPDIASLLAAVDTNQSLLTFFRQQFHKETGSKMFGGNVYDNPVTKPSGFYTERNDSENRTLINNDIDNKSSEELFHLLVQQCSEMVKTDEDRTKLQSVVNMLKAESGSEFIGTGFTPELEVDNYKSPPPPSPNRHSPPSPYSPKSKQSAPETFEGRTLLKGGVEPRHIPKNYLTKCGKSRPVDPRTYTTTEVSLVLPLPKFAEEFWKKEKVKQLRKKNLAIKDDLKKKQDKAAKGHHHQVHLSNKLDPRIAKLEHDTKPNVIESHTVHKVDENQNLLTNEKIETRITGVSAFKAIHDPGFYAAVASVFSGEDEMIQPKDKVKLSSEIDIGAGSKLKSPHMIPVLINTGKSTKYDIEDDESPVIAGHNVKISSHDETVHLNNLVQIETNMNIHPSVGSMSSKLGSQTGPCIGIVKPMQVQNETKADIGQSDDADIRQLNMELSDTEEGEINDVIENKVPDRGSNGFSNQSKRKNGQTQEKEKRIFDRLRQKDEDRRNVEDDRSSCSSSSSASSRGRHHRRSWRGGRYDYNAERNKRSRSRYSSCSSVESRGSDKQHSERKRYHSQREDPYSFSHGSYSYREDSRHSFRPYHDDRQYQRGNRGRYNNKAKFYDRKPQYGKPSYSGKSGYDHRSVEGYDRRNVDRYNRERSNSGSYDSRSSYESRKIVVNDKTEAKSGTQRQDPSFDSSEVTRRHSIEITDSEDEKLSMDYRQKFGKKSSPESSDSHTTVPQSVPLPESYNADKEFLNYSLKKMEMADKVKHDYTAGPIPGISQDKQEYRKNTETFLKNRKETNNVLADMNREKITNQTKSVPKPVSFKVKQTKSVHDRISAKSQVSYKPTKSVHDRIGVKSQVPMKQAKGVHGRIGVKPQLSVNRPQAAADGAGVFRYSDMISLADLEESESFSFKKKN